MTNPEPLETVALTTAFDNQMAEQIENVRKDLDTIRQDTLAYIRTTDGEIFRGYIVPGSLVFEDDPDEDTRILQSFSLQQFETQTVTLSSYMAQRIKNLLSPRLPLSQQPEPEEHTLTGFVLDRMRLIQQITHGAVHPITEPTGWSPAALTYEEQPA